MSSELGGVFKGCYFGLDICANLCAIVRSNMIFHLKIWVLGCRFTLAVVPLRLGPRAKILGRDSP